MERLAVWGQWDPKDNQYVKLMHPKLIFLNLYIYIYIYLHNYSESHRELQDKMVPMELMEREDQRYLYIYIYIHSCVYNIALELET